jgi:hypothetical protein
VIAGRGDRNHAGPHGDGVGDGHRAEPVLVGPYGVLALILGVGPGKTETRAQTLEMDERRRALAERRRPCWPHGQEAPEPPEAARSTSQRVSGHAGEWTEIEVDGEVDGDALVRAARAAAKHARLVKPGVAAEASQSEHARLRDHGAR